MSAKIKIGVLTSSRADYGIYQPLLRLLSHNDNFEIHVIAFGMHLLAKFGNTVKEIESDSFGVIHRIDGMQEADTLRAIGTSYGNLVNAFTSFWSQYKFDWVLALGDRFEMSAAVQASIPFEVNIAHLHGGETTLGATDNIYRHQITLASKLHFVSAELFKTRVCELIESSDNVYNVGALSIDGLEKLALPLWNNVRIKFNIPEVEFILVTLHPETVGVENNKIFAQQAYKAMAQICEHTHLVITMANADAMGNLFRGIALKLKEKFPEQISLVENFGKLNYFAAMRACKYLLGNTSSGIVEAASFKKWVVNVGDRQKGRLRNKNVVDVTFRSELIIEACNKIASLPEYSQGNLFSKENTAKSIMNILEDAQL